MPTPTFSIAIEWENARFAQLERTRRMLRRLRQELIELPPPPLPPQIDFLYDRHTIDGGMVSRVVAEEFRPEETPAASRIIPTEGLRYYQQKNLGAAQTSGEIVIFLDCDVIPEPGWLAAMLAAFDDPAVAAVGGETYVELEGVRSKAFALFWFFNLRDDAADLEPASFFHANNVAFRREVFAAHRFPDLPIYRGQCTLVGDALRSAGLGLFRQKRARVSHPYPLSLGYFTSRALHNGRDGAIVEAIRTGRNRRLRGAYKDYRGRLAYAWRRIGRHRRDVSLSPAGAVAAFGIAFAYFTLQAIGEAVTLARPDMIRRLFPI
jgi:glycosyltransferase involved in cell wall biosynthesis